MSSMSSLGNLLSSLSELKRGSKDGHLRPHKIVMLLAVLSLIKKGVITENKIYFNMPLHDEFAEIFSHIKEKDDLCQPSPPFFHLRSSGFWFHKLKEGREKEYLLLTTSGGGTARIEDNIEFAYLDPEVFASFKDPDQREEIIDHLYMLLACSRGFEMTRIGTAFHETFALNRDSIVQILDAIIEYSPSGGYPEDQNPREYLASSTTLGSNHIKAMPHYAEGIGLIDKQMKLTAFGHFSRRYDPKLIHPSSLWLMHYFMSSPLGCGPLFWNKIVEKLFTPENIFSINELDILIDEVSTSLRNDLGLKKNTIISTRGVFLGTYSNPNGLGFLKLLEELDTNPVSYHIPFPASPVSLWAMAIAFLDFCQRAYLGRATANLQDFLDNSDFEHIFLCSTNRINKMLFLLKEHGYIDLFMTSPPYQIAFLKWDTAPLWEKVYNDSDLD